jgi:hypothetical protein
MKRNGPLALVGLALLALTVFMVGCEDDEVVTPNDGIIAMYASPGTISINETGGQQVGASLITATLVDSQGRVVPDAELTFRTSDGWICPVENPDCYVCPDDEPDCPNGKIPVLDSTSGIGEAAALVIVSIDVPGPAISEISVTAQSAALFGTVAVNREIIAPDENQPPLASIQMAPPYTPSIPNTPKEDDAQVGDVVTFDGSLSLDPDGDTITCYQWDVDSTNDAGDLFVQGVASSAFQRDHDVEQSLNVILRVTDRIGAEDGCLTYFGHPSGVPSGARLGLEWFYGESVDSLNDYRIGCANLAPIADAGADKNVPWGIGTTVQVLMDASGSRDDDGRVEEYLWDCGNGVPPLAASVPWQAYCRYNRVAQTYIAQVTVFDNGTNTIDPATGTWACQRSDFDQTTVTIVDPNAP